MRSCDYFVNLNQIVKGPHTFSEHPWTPRRPPKEPGVVRVQQRGSMRSAAYRDPSPDEDRGRRNPCASSVAASSGGALRHKVGKSRITGMALGNYPAHCDAPACEWVSGALMTARTISGGSPREVQMTFKSHTHEQRRPMEGTQQRKLNIEIQSGKMKSSPISLAPRAGSLFAVSLSTSRIIGHARPSDRDDGKRSFQHANHLPLRADWRQDSWDRVDLKSGRPNPPLQHKIRRAQHRLVRKRDLEIGNGLAIHITRQDACGRVRDQITSGYG